MIMAWLDQNESMKLESMKIKGINGWSDLDQMRPMAICNGIWL